MLRLIQICLLCAVGGLFSWVPESTILLAVKYVGILILLGLMISVGSILGEDDYRRFLRKRIEESGSDPEDILSGHVVEGEVVSSRVRERGH